MSLFEKYVVKREKWLELIMDFHNISRHCAKKIVLKLCYLGNYELDDNDDINRCCICLDIQQIVNICNSNVCQVCFNRSKKFLYDLKCPCDDLESLLIDLIIYIFIICPI